MDEEYPASVFDDFDKRKIRNHLSVFFEHLGRYGNGTNHQGTKLGIETSVRMLYESFCQHKTAQPLILFNGSEMPIGNRKQNIDEEEYKHEKEGYQPYNGMFRH